MNYTTKPCAHCGKHSHVDTQYCPWCWRPYKPAVFWRGFGRFAWVALPIVAAAVSVVLAAAWALGFWS